MIDQYNDDGTGWARFSDDMTMRYRLARRLTDRPGAALRFMNLTEVAPIRATDPIESEADRCVFVMLNPSTADAFRHDPTVGECIKRARALGADVLEVVNLFALRSPYPADLKKCAAGFRGDDDENNAAILAACTGAEFVIAAWGNHGALDYRDLSVLNMLRDAGIMLHHLGTTQDGYPKHPLARGKHRIPGDHQPIPWSTT
jgi:hypothetical protein